MTGEDPTHADTIDWRAFWRDGDDDRESASGGGDRRQPRQSSHSRPKGVV